MEKINTGQVWAFPASENLPPLMVFIGCIDQMDNQIIASVMIVPHPEAEEAVWPRVSHLPIALESLGLEEGRMVKEGVDISAQMREGYTIWLAKYRTGAAGVFNTTVAEAYTSVVYTKNNSR